MKYTSLIIYLFVNLVSIGQVDSSGVFVVGDNTNTKDEVRSVNEYTTFKFDVAKIYMGQSLFSVEHLLKNKKSSIEPEIVILWEPYEWVFNYYTQNKTFSEENFTTSSINGYQYGVGFGYKRYINKRKEGLFGHYLGTKFRSQFGLFGQYLTKNYLNSLVVSPVQTHYYGFVIINELSIYYGHSFWAFDLVQIDPFIGLSAAGTYIDYGEYQFTVFDPWKTNKELLIQPSIIFGVRLGFSSRLGRLFGL